MVFLCVWELVIVSIFVHIISLRLDLLYIY